MSDKFVPGFAGASGQPLANVGREPVDADVYKVQVQLFQLRLGRVAVRTASDAVNHNLQEEITNSAARKVDKKVANLLLKVAQKIAIVSIICRVRTILQSKSKLQLVICAEK